MRPGDLLLIFFIWYAVVRFSLEFLRTGNWTFFGIPTAMLVSGVLIVISLAALAYRHGPWARDAERWGEPPPPDDDRDVIDEEEVDDDEASTTRRSSTTARTRSTTKRPARRPPTGDDEVVDDDILTMTTDTGPTPPDPASTPPAGRPGRG